MSPKYKIDFQRWGSPQQVILVVFLGVSILLNLVLCSQVIALRQKVKGVTAEAKLEAGSPVSPISVKGLNGEPSSISYQGSGLPTILYIFSPKCLWCASNLENAKALARGTNGQYRFIALSLSDDDLRTYVADHDIQFTVYGGLSDQTRADYLLGRTPQTIVISADGHVQKNWAGAYGADIARQVEEYFHIALPGLTSSQKQAKPQEEGK